MADRPRLVTLRGGSRGAATRLIARMAQINTDANQARPRKIHELRQKLVDLNTLLEKIEDLDSQIFDATEVDDLEAEQNASETVNNVIRDARDTYMYQINELIQEETVANAQVPVPNINTARTASRPKIQLPRFNGEILKWQPFWQAFDAEIHSDPNTANINKFNYLIGQLQPHVASVVAGLTPSNANYPELVNLLEERYGSVPKIIAAHMRALYGLAKPDGSLGQLRNFYDLLEANIRGLEALGKTPDTYGDLLVCILLDKLPTELRKNMARQHDQDEWNLEQLRKTLRGEIRVLEAGQSSLNVYSRFQRSTVLTSGASVTQRPLACAYCGGGHFSNECSTHKSVADRLKVVNNKRLCINCLRPGHLKNDCRSKKRCRSCRGSHHSSLHEANNTSSNALTTQTATPPATPSASLTTITVNVPQDSSSSSNAVLNAVVHSSPLVFLKTAIAPVIASRGTAQVNIMLDEGSQRTFITKEMLSRIKFKVIRQERLILSGFAAVAQVPKHYDVIEFFILTKDKSSVPVKAIVVPKIASSLDDSHRETLKSLSYLKDLDLAHLPTGKDTFSIEMLIGADFFWSFIGSEAPIRGEGPTAIKSRLGYLVSGPLQGVQVNNENAVSSFGVMAVEEDNISRLWTLESIGIQPQYETSREVADYAKKLHHVSK